MTKITTPKNISSSNTSPDRRGLNAKTLTGRSNHNNEQKTELNIGTRGSPLALIQAEEVKKQILSLNNNIKCNIITIETSGDKFLNSDLKEIGGKGLFTKEIEQALLTGKIDLAVHSMKDVPTLRQAGLEIISMLPRQDVRDAFISEKYESLDDLPISAHIGTASLRRTAQLRKKRPDLRISILRGNVQTRLEKVKSGKYNATLLAMAGLKRLKMEHIAKQVFSVEDLLPAPAQGAIGIEVSSKLSDNNKKLLQDINCHKTFVACTAERAFLEALDGNCRTPIAAYAIIENQNLIIKGQLLSENGLRSVLLEDKGSIQDAYIIGKRLGERVKKEFFI